jgi:hypothetical protein
MQGRSFTPKEEEMDPKLLVWEDGDVDIKGLLEEDVMNLIPTKEDVANLTPPEEEVVNLANILDFYIPHRVEIVLHAGISLKSGPVNEPIVCSPLAGSARGSGITLDPLLT